MPPPLPPEECAERLLRLLTAQGALFAQVRDLAGRLMAPIEAGDTDGLMRVLSEKQRLMGQNDRLKAEMAPWLAAWEEARETADPALRAPVEEALETLRGHMTAIFGLEEEARTRLEGARSEAGDRVTRVQAGKAVLRAYGRPAGEPPPARYRDRPS